MKNEKHICTNRCNDDIDCDVCDHGVNVAQDECTLCQDQEADVKERIPVGMAGIIEETERLKALIN